MRSLSLCCIMLLSAVACTPTTTPLAAAGELQIGGDTYPIERLESFPEQWRVVTPDGRVACRAPTKDDCYWSLRAHLQAQANLDALE